MFFEIGSYFQSASWAHDTGVSCSPHLSTGGHLAKIAAHAAAGGILQHLQGGRFGSGFLAAGTTETQSPAIEHVDHVAGRILTAAMIGGTVSTLSGGKFANGAATAFFQESFNDGIHRIFQRSMKVVTLSVSPLNDPNGYKDENDAALAQYKAYESIYATTVGTHLEALGLIVRQGNEFVFTDVTVVPDKFDARIIPNGFSPSDVAGYTHTHPTTEGFNGLDFKSPAANHVPYFVRTSDGFAYRWDPAGAAAYESYVNGLVGKGASYGLPEHINDPTKWGIIPICPGGGACLTHY
jgi:hypothetical protein